LNIPDVVSATITSLAFIGGGIGLYTSSESRDAVIDQRVESLLDVAERNSTKIEDITKTVGNLSVKQEYNDKSREEFMYDIRKLTEEIKQVNRHLLNTKG